MNPFDMIKTAFSGSIGEAILWGAAGLVGFILLIAIVDGRRSNRPL